MIDYKQIKNTLNQGIWENLGVFFVDLESGDPRPDEQEGIDRFVSHKITTPYTSKNRGIQQSDGDTLTYTLEPTMTISLTCYAPQIEDALNLCHELIKWFEFQGYQYLKDNDLIVQSIESVQDRTTFLETHHDARAGFDVILRTTDVESRQIDTIETAEVNNRKVGK